jgi:4-hydroxybenzoate polyprenyltransferase
MLTLPVLQPVYSIRFWKSYGIQMRPYLLFISGIAGAAGMAITKTEGTEWWKLILCFIPFFLGYGFGQALTDSFQTDTDKISAPYRPLSKGIISKRSVLTVSITGLLLSGLILYMLSLFSFLLSLLAVFGLATYSYIKRNIWFAGPFYNACIVTLLPLMGYYALNSSGTNSLPAEMLNYLGVSFFSYASFVLIGYLKDIDADRETGYKTFPVVWGWNKSVLAGDAFAIASILLFWTTTKENFYETGFGVLATIIIIYGQLKGHVTKQKNEKGALVPIVSTVRSFILFHIAIILHYQPQWLIYLVSYYILFEIFLYKRPSKYQV